MVHCCHCRLCQRESGASFALNGLLEARHVTIIGPAQPDLVATPSAHASTDKRLARCPECRVAVWNTYGDARMLFLRVGTLDQPDTCPPMIHIYVGTKQPWLTLPEGIPAVEDGSFAHKDLWSEASRARLEALLAEMRENEVKEA